MQKVMALFTLQFFGVLRVGDLERKRNIQKSRFKKSKALKK